MTTATRELESLASPSPVWARFLSATYGPYAFGIVCFLVIWYAAVTPQLNAARVDAGVIIKIQDGQREIVHAMDKLVDRIEKATERLESHR